MLDDDGRGSREHAPLLLVAEGLDGIVDPALIRGRLTELFGRPVVALADPRADRAVGTLWLAADAQQLTLRLSTPQRADLWRRLSLRSLRVEARVPARERGNDAAALIVSGVLDMLWGERLGPAPEILDPFCPPGMVCVEASQLARRQSERRRLADPSVLDPWDPSYQRFRGGDPLAPAAGYHDRGDPWANDASLAVAAAPFFARAPEGALRPRVARAVPSDKALSAARRESAWALGILAGGGVHEGGGFARYEVNALRRFPRFDVGLAFVGARGQPDAARSVRRAVTALVQRRFVMPGLEVDLGLCMGTFVATDAHASADVRPYLRGIGTFAIATSAPLEILLQSEIATTFSTVHAAGAIEYALSVGIRPQL